MFHCYHESLANQHQRNTKNGHNLLHILGHDRDIAASSIRIAGAKVWNNLNNNLKNIPKVKKFRAKFEKKLIASYNETN